MTTTTDATPAPGAPALTSDGTVLAEVDGIGSVRSHEEADATLTVTAATAEAPALPDSALAIADGLGVEVEGTPTGPLEVRLQLPDPPTPDAIPVVVHVRDDGTTVLESGLYDDATNEIVVGARTFSDRFGAWWDPRNWIEEVIQVGQGGFDFVSDYISGRTDPPACSPAAPSWAKATKTDLSTVHVCLKSNPAKDGTQRAEIYLKSNRATAQFISVPAGEYQWVQGQPDWLQPILNAAVTGTPGDILLLGGQAMSVGYRQPFQDVKLEARTYQTQLVGIVNQVAGILGVFEPEDVYAMATLAASCLEDVTGFDPKNLDVVPDGFGDLDGFVGAMITCVISLAQNPDLAISTLDEVLRGAGTSASDRGKFLGSIRGRVDRLAPLAKKVAAALNVAGATIRAWDGMWDNVNEGLLTVNLTGTEETGVAVPAGPGRWSVQFTHPTWGPVTLTTTEVADKTQQGPASIVVTDASGKTRWSREADPLYTLVPIGTGLEMEHEDPARPAIDKLGHIFLNYNPGRYNGVGVLVPTKDGFDDLATVPIGDDYDQRFYSSAATDRNGDGTYEIRVFTNDCEPSCAGGTTTSEDFDWNGYDYSIGGAGLAECGHAELDDDYGDDNTISSLRVAKGSCGVAMALALRLADEHNFYDGPRTFRSGNFDCRAELYDEDYELPSGGYECSDGTASVTWFKT